MTDIDESPVFAKTPEVADDLAEEHDITRFEINHGENNKA
jgi:hypothetical protein